MSGGSGRNPGPVRRTFYRFERMLLGIGMTMIAFVIERRLLKAIKQGGVKAAPRTAAGGDAPESETHVTAAHPTA
jgi:hypothetical protein